MRILLRQHAEAEVREWGDRVKAGETQFVVRLSNRNQRVFTHHVPEVLNGMTLVRLTEQ